MDIYAENILDHFRSPRNHGELQEATIDHEEANVECGDVIHVWVKLERAPSPSLSSSPESHRGVEKHGKPLHSPALPSGRAGSVEESKVRGSHIAAIGWTGTGCAISQASMSMLSEDVMGKEVSEVESLNKDDVYALLGVPIGPRRFKCALMSLHTVKNVLRKARGLPVQSWVETVALGEGE